MTAAGIKHKHVSDAQLTDAIKKSSTPGVWVVDEEAAKEWVEFYNYYDFHWQLTRYEGMRSDASHPSTSPTRANGSSETSG
jgi:hypothetical protein